MRSLRVIVTMFMVVTLMWLPVFVSAPGRWDGATSVNAAPLAGPAQDRHPWNRNKNENWNGNENGNGNGNNNNNNNDNGNSNANNNDNDDDNGNGNANSNSNDNDDNDNVQDRGRGPVGPPPPPPLPPTLDSRCYAAGEAGAISLTLPGGTVALTVVPASTFPRTSQVTLAKIDPSTAPATPGARLDDIVFDVRAQDGCDGASLNELLADANLGLNFTVAANAPSLTFAVWDGSRWLDLPTTPDPSKPYVSATIRRTGIYTVYQRP